jgi:predicted phage terminase large subunit-like protein
LRRIVIAVDPAVSNHEGSDETGIIVAGLGQDNHVYIIEDLSGRYAPTEWAARAVCAYHRHQADRVVIERNQGGLMAEGTIRVQDGNVPITAVHASRGKVTRAEPISALYEQGRVHHVGNFSKLEDQLTSFTSDFDRGRAGFSPDRLDALVWACTELVPQKFSSGETFWQLFQMEKAAAQKSGDAPMPVTKEWARGSIEYDKFMRGEIGPPR